MWTLLDVHQKAKQCLAAERVKSTLKISARQNNKCQKISTDKCGSCAIVEPNLAALLCLSHIKGHKKKKFFSMCPLAIFGGPSTSEPNLIAQMEVEQGTPRDVTPAPECGRSSS
jgi:hypothetical protein